MKYILPLALSILLIACNRQPPYNPAAIELNNQAVSLMETDPNKAVSLLDSAHMLDSTYLLPIQNKVNLYIKTKKYEDANVAIDQMISQLESPEIWQMKGLLLFKTNHNEAAMDAIQHSLQLYRDQLNNGQSNNKYASQYQIGICLLLNGNYEEGMQLIEKYGTMAHQANSKLDSVKHYAQDIPKLVHTLLQ